jgi:prepilin-type N-terminal cleavage/methylation domain-containing protein
MSMKYLSNEKGFTLVELLVAIAIVAILAVIGLTVFSGLQASARDTKRRADVDAIAAALENHYNNTPNEKCTGNAGTYCPVVGTWFGGNSVPTDPQTGNNYANLPTSASAVPTFNVCTTLESGVSYCRTQRQ